MNEVIEYEDRKNNQMVYQLRIDIGFIASKKTLKWWKVEVTWMLIKMLWHLMQDTSRNPSIVKVERKPEGEECK
jgi:hypothetical protein